MRLPSFRYCSKIAAFSLLLPIFFGQKVPQITYTDNQYLVQKPTPKITIAQAQPKPESASIKIQIASSDIFQLIHKYALEFGGRADIMITIANCESGMKPEALSASGTYAGLYQFNSSTWASNRKALGLDPNPDLRFQAEEAIKTAAFKMGRDGYGAWPACSEKAFAIASL